MSRSTVRKIRRKIFARHAKRIRKINHKTRVRL